MVTVIEEATDVANFLRRRAREFDDAAHQLDQALRSARITKVGTGILHRQPISYEEEVRRVEVTLDRVEALGLF